MKQGKNSFDEPAKIIRREDAPEETVYALTFSEAFINFFKKRFSKDNFRRIIKESFPQKGDSTKEKIRKCIMDVSFVFLILGLSYMVFYYQGYRERVALFEQWEVSIDELDVDSIPDYEIKKLWENIKKQYPDVDFPEGMSIKFASLYAVNQDAVGVLRIPEKELWVPLFQSLDSPDYYLWKDMYGEYNRYGNPYVDYRCDMTAEGPGKNTIIYGHNTHDKLGFNVLESYMTVDGYKEAPVINLETLYNNTQWKIFAVMLTNSTPAADRGYVFKYIYPEFSSDEQFMGVIGSIFQRSMINTGVDVRADDKILTLYTCYQNIFEGGRLVVFARLLREGESAEIDTSLVSFNSSARYPQIYYDKLGLKNPYEHLTVPNEGYEDVTSAVVESTLGETPSFVTPVTPEIPPSQQPENTSGTVNPSETSSVPDASAPSAEQPSEPVATQPVVQPTPEPAPVPAPAPAPAPESQPDVPANEAASQ